jgi:hypothetical protein
MEVIAAGIAYALKDGPSKILAKLGLASLVAGSSVPFADLAPSLSPSAAIILPGDASFEDVTSRWREWHAPEVAAVVQVATHNDVQETVRRPSTDHRSAWFTE